MKNLLLGVLMLSCIAGVSLSGCSDDPCETSPCDNGTCEDSGCVCASGYEGEFCDFESRTRWLGTWEVGDICRTVAVVYNLEISAGSAPNEIILNNLNEAGFATSGVVDGIDVTFPEQQFGTGAISGLGGIDLSTGIISLEYVVDDGNGNLQTCQASLQTP